MASVTTATHKAPQAQIAELTALPYQPSWVDRVTGWVRRLPGPAWAFYLGVWLVLFPIETVVKWADRAYPAGTLFPYHAVLVAYSIYFLALMHYLNDVAGAALRDFRPALQVSDAEFSTLRYRLTTMPARPTLLVTALGFIVANVLVLLSNSAAANALTKLNTSPLSTVLDHAIAVFGWSTWGVLIYHGIRQLRLANHLYTTAPNLDLFRPSPLYAFAGLSARTAVGWVGIIYAGLAAAPGLFDNPATAPYSALVAIPLTLLAALIFIAPLVGVHRILESQKLRHQDEVGQRLAAANIELQRRIDAQGFSDMTPLKDGIIGLVAVRDELFKLRTWPWQPGTARGLGAALLLPLLIWGIQRLLERLGL